jgi:Phage integrase, N-terminal SAM-like domain
MGPAEVEAFLNDLVVNHRVAALTQSQALNAIVFLYDSVLSRPLGQMAGLKGVQRRQRVPGLDLGWGEAGVGNDATHLPPYGRVDFPLGRFINVAPQYLLAVSEWLATKWPGGGFKQEFSGKRPSVVGNFNREE